MKKTIFSLLITAFCLTHSFAQLKPEKWGKIPENDLKMTVYPADSSASAVVLQDLGELSITMLARGYAVELKHARRIKVLDEKAFDQGNLRIVYGSRDADERFFDLDIQVTLPNGEKQKVKSDNVFTEKINKYYLAKKIFIPNLQKGSVIEYRYTRQSEDFFSLYNWYFQDDLPIRWSQLEVSIPTAFEYVNIVRTGKMFDLQETDNTNTIYFTRYGMANMPALKPEPFITTLDDYRAHIGFQLKSYDFGSGVKKVMTSWEDVAKVLDEHEHFGGQFNKTFKFKDAWKAFSADLKPGATPDQIALQALQFVKSQFKWNENYRVFAVDGLDEAYKKKTGSSADLNLMLVALLKKADVEAFPILVSTRDNGEMAPDYPYVAQFNSVVAAMKTGAGFTLLDATDPFNALNELREEHYNGIGWIADAKQNAWVEINPNEASETWYGQLSLAETGEMNGSFSMSLGGAIATQWRNAMDQKTTKDVVQKAFSGDFPEMTADSVAVANQGDLAKPLQLQFKCKIPGAANQVNDFLYVRPVLDFWITDNPFKTVQRTYPVDFPYPAKMNYVLSLELPAGYTVEELPEAARITLPDNASKISFTCTKQSERKIQVILKMNIARLHFPPEEYGALRKFFDLAAEKTQLQLVLKKI